MQRFISGFPESHVEDCDYFNILNGNVTYYF